MARKVQLKNKNGEKAYPVTSSELVKMSSGGGNLDGKLTELDNKISSVSFTTSYYGNKIIKELYLIGCSEDEQYKIYLSKGNDFQITRISDSTLVARAGGSLNFAQFAEVKEVNSSGIHGYVVFDWSNWNDNWIVSGGAANVPATYLTKQSYKQLDLCPIIKMFLNYAESTRVKYIEDNLIIRNYTLPNVGENLFNPNDPYISVESGITYSGYIPVKGKTYLRLVGYRTGGAVLRFYDDSFNLIDRSTEVSITGVYSIFKGSSYVRFPITDDYKNKKVIAIVGDDNTKLGDYVNIPFTTFLNQISSQDLQKMSVLYDRLGENIFELINDKIFTYNLLDKSKFVSGYLSVSGVGTNDSYRCTELHIQVNPGQKYKINGLRNDFSWMYDQNKNVLYKFNDSNALHNDIIVIPQNVYYIRVTCVKGDIDKVGVINDENWDYTLNGVLEYGKYIVKDSLDFSNIEIPLKDNTVTPSKCTFFSIGKNLYNEDDPDFAYGHYLNPDTGLASNTNISYKTSGYIPITNEQIGKYVNVSDDGSRTSTRLYVFCNSDKKVIESYDGDTKRAYLIPENAAYYRCTVKVSNTKVQIEISDVENGVTSYEPYKKYIPSEYLPSDIGGDSIQVFLPSEICIAVGRTIELYNKQVALCGNYDNFHFKYTATNSGGQSIGKLYVDKFSIPVTSSDQVGEYTLALEVLDNNLNTVATANSVIKVVDKPSSLSPQNLMMVGDSLGNKPWLPEIRKLANDIFGEQKITWVGTLNAYAGINNTYPNYEKFCKNEGRSGWTAGYYISDGAKFTQIILNVTGVTVAPARKKQYYIPAKKGGNMTYEVEEVLNENGLPYEDNGGTISQISMNQVVNSWSTPDGQATGGTITAKNTSSAGDNTINYTSWSAAAGNPFWNPTGGDGSGAVDFNWYFQQNGIPVPSAMFPMLGMNGHNADDLYEFIRLYREQVPTSKVIAMIPHFTGDLNIDLNKKKTIFDFNVAICNKLKGMDGVYIAPVFITHDSDHNFFVGEENVNPRNESIKIPSLADIVHPQNAGYMQYADIGFSTWLAHLVE